MWSNTTELALALGLLLNTFHVFRCSNEIKAMCILFELTASANEGLVQGASPQGGGFKSQLAIFVVRRDACCEDSNSNLS